MALTNPLQIQLQMDRDGRMSATLSKGSPLTAKTSEFAIPYAKRRQSLGGKSTISEANNTFDSPTQGGFQFGGG